jgi:N-acetylmuramoyl-L-alanine amidase
MKIFLKIIMIFILIIVSGFKTTNHKNYKIRKIIIDAGHGGKDSGALGSFSQEKNITLKVACQLGKLIQTYAKDIQVIYTRQKDEFIALHQRANIANKNNADIFISIHCNASLNNKRARGTETFTMGIKNLGQNLAVTKRENAVILLEDGYEGNYHGFDPRAPESHILFSLYQNAYHENSLKLANYIESCLKNNLGRKSRGVKQDALLVLWKTNAPSVLVEIGFITDLEEEKYLNSSHGQKKIAEAIFIGIKQYKQDIETYT